MKELDALTKQAEQARERLGAAVEKDLVFKSDMHTLFHYIDNLKAQVYQLRVSVQDAQQETRDGV